MSTSHTDIESWELYSDAGGRNRQQQLTSTEKNPREDLPAIADLTESPDIATNMPLQALSALVRLARETPRVTKRNVLPDYDSDLETYTAETVETTVPRLPTHEPCVEHVPARFEPAVDLEQRLQKLLAGSNPESEDYVQYRNSEGSTRFATVPEVAKSNAVTEPSSDADQPDIPRALSEFLRANNFTEAEADAFVQSLGGTDARTDFAITPTLSHLRGP